MKSHPHKETPHSPEQYNSPKMAKKPLKLIHTLEDHQQAKHVNAVCVQAAVNENQQLIVQD